MADRECVQGRFRYLELDDAALEAKKQLLRAERRRLENVVARFSKKRVAGTGSTGSRVLRCSERDLFPADIANWERYNWLGDEALAMQAEQGRRKAYKRSLERPFNYWREYAKIANTLLSLEQVEYIQDILTARMDIEDLKSDETEESDAAE